MSKRFKSQDYARYKKLGIRWRRPVGRHSKMKIQKGGSPSMPRIGFRTPKSVRYMCKVSDSKGSSLVNASIAKNIEDLETLKNNGANAIIISSGVGSKKALAIADRAKQMDLRVINMKKVKRAKKTEKKINDRKGNVKKKDTEKVTTAKEEKTK